MKQEDGREDEGEEELQSQRQSKRLHQNQTRDQEKDKNHHHHRRLHETIMRERERVQKRKLFFPWQPLKSYAKPIAIFLFLGCEPHMPTSYANEHHGERTEWFEWMIPCESFHSSFSHKRSDSQDTSTTCCHKKEGVLIGSHSMSEWVRQAKRTIG